MLTITNNASDELKLNLANPDNSGLYIRFAVDNTNDEWKYLMGFDELKYNDIHLEDNNIEYIVSYENKELLEGATIDYDEIDVETGYGFIFLNPNDPNFKKPTK